MEKRKSAKTTNELALESEIIRVLQNEELTLSDIQLALKSYPKRDIENTINYLIDHDKIELTGAKLKTVSN